MDEKHHDLGGEDEYDCASKKIYMSNSSLNGQHQQQNIKHSIKQKMRSSSKFENNRENNRDEKNQTKRNNINQINLNSESNDSEDFIYLNKNYNSSSEDENIMSVTQETESSIFCYVNDIIAKNDDDKSKDGGGGYIIKDNKSNYVCKNDEDLIRYLEKIADKQNSVRIVNNKTLKIGRAHV